MKRNVLVTGGAKGIGREIAQSFLKNGDNVIISYNTSKIDALELEKLGCFIIKADVSSKKEVEEMFSVINNKFGGVDVLVNNAGISHYGLITDTTEDEWDRIFAVNTKGVYLVTNCALENMISKKQGKIINISSMWGVLGASCEVAYSASKSAVIGYTKALAKEVGLSGINVNCVCPGVIKTDMIKNLSEETMLELANSTSLNRIGETKDISEIVLFLASESASFITGQVISVDGGFLG